MIRPVAIALVEHRDHLLLMRIENPDRGVGHRPLGGTIEFGERAADTVVREFREELGAELVEVRYVGVVENIFSYWGEERHEIMVVHAARLAEPERYWTREDMALADDPCVAVWVPVDDVLSERVLFFPEEGLPLVRSVYERRLPQTLPPS